VFSIDARYLDSFIFEEHSCLVLELYDCTLMNVGRSKTHHASGSMKQAGHSMAGFRHDTAHSLLIQPRYAMIPSPIILLSIAVI